MSSPFTGVCFLSSLVITKFHLFSLYVLLWIKLPSKNPTIFVELLNMISVLCLMFVMAVLVPNTNFPISSFVMLFIFSYTLPMKYCRKIIANIYYPPLLKIRVVDYQVNIGINPLPKKINPHYPPLSFLVVSIANLSRGL